MITNIFTDIQDGNTEKRKGKKEREGGREKGKKEGTKRRKSNFSKMNVEKQVRILLINA